MERRTSSWALLVSVLPLAGCASTTQLSVNPQYRGAKQSELPAPTAVLPVHLCSPESGASNAQQKLAEATFPAEMWKTMRAPGDVRTYRAAGDPICTLLTQWRNERDTKSFQLTPEEQAKAGDALAKHPGKSSLVIPFVYMTESADKGDKDKKHDPADVSFGVWILAKDHVAYLRKAQCGPDSRRYCFNVAVDDGYKNAGEAVKKNLVEFPWAFLGLNVNDKGEPSGEITAELLAPAEKTGGDAPVVAAAATTSTTPVAAAQPHTAPAQARTAAASPPPSAPAAASNAGGSSDMIELDDVPPKPAMLFKSHQRVEVHSGRSWRKAIVLEGDAAGGRYHVSYTPKKSEWVAAGRIRPGHW
jgi:hypothetical protein